MKKLQIALLAAGTLAIPAVVLASHGADNTNRTVADARQEHAVSASPSPGATLGASDDRDNDEDDTVSTPSPTASPSATPAATPTATPATAAAAVNFSQAQAAAEKAHPGSTIVRAELEREHGALVYQFRFADGARVQIDSTTGEVVGLRSNQGGHGGHGSED